MLSAAPAGRPYRARRGPGFLSLLAALALVPACGVSPDRGPESDAARLAEINMQLGVAYLREGNYPLALDRLQKSVAAAPDAADTHLALAVLHERIGRDEVAEAEFQTALRLKPDLAEAHTNYGAFLCRADRVEEAEEHFRQAFENPLYQNREVALTNAGLCLARKGALEKADGYLRRALEVNPQFPPALLAMAELSYQDRDLEGTRSFLERYLGTSPPTPQSLWLGVRVERELGNRKAAASYAQILTTRFPDSAEARSLRKGEGR